MFSPELRGFLYGVLITTSLVSVITYASGPDGVFGDYFERMIDDAIGCGVNTAITGFDATPGVTYGTQECTAFDTIVRTVLGVGTAPSGQAVVGFDINGDPVYGDVNWHKDVSENISHTGAGNVGIGTDTPGATLTVSGSLQIQDGTQGNGKVLTSDANGNASWEVATGGGGGGAAIWEDVPLTDTNDFDVQCNYIFTVGGTTYRATYIKSGIIGEVSTLFDGNTTATWLGIKKGSKSTLEMHQDNWSNNMIYGNLVVSSIKKNCNGGSGGGGDLQFGGTYLWRGGWGSMCIIPNSITGVCSCPTGYTSRQSALGGYYHYSPWDSYYIGYTCEKNGGGGTSGGLGYSQTWQDMTASRVLGTTYTNSTGKPISVNIIGGSPGGASSATLIIDGIEVDYYTTNAYNGTLHGIVPPGSTYSVIGSNWTFTFGAPYGWKELR